MQGFSSVVPPNQHEDISVPPQGHQDSQDEPNFPLSSSLSFMDHRNNEEAQQRPPLDLRLLLATNEILKSFRPRVRVLSIRVLEVASKFCNFKIGCRFCILSITGAVIVVLFLLSYEMQRWHRRLQQDDIQRLILLLRQKDEVSFLTLLWVLTHHYFSLSFSSSEKYKKQIIDLEMRLN